MKKNNKKIIKESESGEFIPSFFSWNTLTGQKHRAKELSNKTNKHKNH